MVDLFSLKTLEIFSTVLTTLSLSGGLIKWWFKPRVTCIYNCDSLKQVIKVWLSFFAQFSHVLLNFYAFHLSLDNKKRAKIKRKVQLRNTASFVMNRRKSGCVFQQTITTTCGFQTSNNGKTTLWVIHKYWRDKNRTFVIKLPSLFVWFDCTTLLLLEILRLRWTLRSDLFIYRRKQQ